jgi:hypothetical protein
MYRRSKFLELLLEIRCEMAEQAGYDVDEFVQNLSDASGSPVANDQAETANARLNGSEIRKAEAVVRKYDIRPVRL